MEILLALSTPVFYIIGLVVFIKWLARMGRKSKSDTDTRSEIAAQIRARAQTHEGKLRQELLGVADAVALNVSIDSAVQSIQANDHTVYPADTSQDHANPHVDAKSGISAEPSLHPGGVASVTPTTNWTSRDITAGLRTMDNINLLLYLGAFLVVVSAGIFVGYNFEVLSGTFKTTFLALFAIIFYVVGLGLFLKAPKLRPAGITFTGIGLVLLPLVGLAAYNFTSAHEHGSVLWFAMSVFTLVAYGVTLAITRQTYVAYLMAFTTLSLFESGVSLINLPVYWFGWGMALTSVLLAMLASWRGWWSDAAESLKISANVFVPVSLVFAVLFSTEHGLAQLGITVGLAGIFYGLMAAREAKAPVGEAYWLMALVALPAALGTSLADTLSLGGEAILLVSVAVGYVALGWVGRTALSQKWREMLGLMAGLLPLAAAVLVVVEPPQLLSCLVAAIVVNVIFALWLRQSVLAFMATLSSLAIPFVLLRQVPAEPLSWGIVATGYLVLTGALVAWRQKLRGWADSGDMVGAAGYLLGLLLAIIAASLDGPHWLLVIGLLTTVALLGLSYLENRAEYVYVAAVSAYLALFQIHEIAGWPFEYTALVMLLAGAGIYGIGAVLPDSERAKALRYSGLIGPYIGAITGLNFDSDNLAPVASLAVGGGLLWAEARRQNQPSTEEVAGGILILSYNWMLSRLDITQAQLFTLPWAAYLGYLAYRRRARGHQVYDIFAAGALAVLTLPIAGQAMEEGGQLYGLELILIGLGLVVVGAATRYRLLAWWGAGTLVAEVLYQMRDFLYALPKYLISAGLGLALLAVAIVLLQRRRND